MKARGVSFPVRVDVGMCTDVGAPNACRSLSDGWLVFPWRSWCGDFDFSRIDGRRLCMDAA